MKLWQPSLLVRSLRHKRRRLSKTPGPKIGFRDTGGSAGSHFGVAIADGQKKRDTGEPRILEPGQALAETVETTHRGFTTDEPVELIVFYAGRSRLLLTINQD